jgi:hypothetical protein
MPYTDTWDATFEAVPANADAVSGGAEVIRDLKVAIRERLTNGSTGVQGLGVTDGPTFDHVHLTNQPYPPPNLIANSQMLAWSTTVGTGHSKTASLTAEQFTNTDNAYGYGEVLLKLTKGANTAEYYNFDTLIIGVKDCQDRAVAFGFYAYSVTESANVKGSILDSNSEIALSSTFGRNHWICFCYRYLCKAKSTCG